MVKNLGGEWEPGRKVVDAFCASVPHDAPDFSARWGSGKQGGTTLVFDLGWFKRSWNNFTENPDGYYQIGVNHLNWLPEWRQTNWLARWKLLDLPILDFKYNVLAKEKPNVLVVGQVQDDAQHGLTRWELRNWLDAKSTEISKQFPQAPTFQYRPHPQSEEWAEVVESEECITLQQDLDWADIVLTYNSTVGLEALRQGIPVVCSTNCFYRELSGLPPMRSREPFFSRLSHAQWTLAEISDGTAYKFYRRFL